MALLKRLIKPQIDKALGRGKSVLLLGPRQVGKTTLIKEEIRPDISYSFAKAKVRLRYEKDLVLFEKELEMAIEKSSKKPVIFIDEVQKIPQVMDSVQAIIDEGLAQFILTGSSALKLKHGAKLNLLPGRVVSLTMSPLVYEELPSPKPSLDDLLVYGTLPEISLEEDRDNREKDLFSYVSTYLEEEIRAEAAVRNLGFFSRFLELAAGEAGNQINLSNLSRDIGVTHQTISSYFQILDDSLVATRIDPIVNGRTKRRLFKSPKYLFFDLGIRRVAANEGVRLPQSFLGDLFEHYVGNELLNLSALTAPEIKIRYWRDTAGPEVDYVIDWGKEYIPVEVKYSEAPQKRDARHLETFLSEYSEATDGFVICRTPHAYRLSDRVIALPWQELDTLFQRNS